MKEKQIIEQELANNKTKIIDLEYQNKLLKDKFIDLKNKDSLLKDFKKDNLPKNNEK